MDDRRRGEMIERLDAVVGVHFGDRNVAEGALASRPAQQAGAFVVEAGAGRTAGRVVARSPAERGRVPRVSSENRARSRSGQRRSCQMSADNAHASSTRFTRLTEDLPMALDR